jgi:membrane protein YqaA with SNARE-associated domain
MDRISEFAHRVSEFLQQLAESWGGPGLALVAFCDSSFLTLPEVADLLVAVSTIREPHNWFFFAAVTALGSVLGSYALFLVGRKGGEALVRRGFHERHVDRVLEWFRRHGALVLVLPAMMPPPMPFKAFVVTAGVSGVRTLPFVTAVAVGRLTRYGGVAWLARTYGEDTLRFIQGNAFSLLWPVMGAVILAVLGWWLWRRLRTPT